MQVIIVKFGRTRTGLAQLLKLGVSASKWNSNQAQIHRVGNFTRNNLTSISSSLKQTMKGLVLYTEGKGKEQSPSTGTENLFRFRTKEMKYENY